MTMHEQTLITTDAADCLLFWRCTPALARLSGSLPCMSPEPTSQCEAQQLDCRADVARPSALQEQTSALGESPRLHGSVPEPCSGAVEHNGAYWQGAGRSYGSSPGVPAAEDADQLVGSTAPRMVCDFVVGLNSTARHALLWLPPQGLLLYAVDNTVVVDDLQSRRQRFLVLNRQPVQCMASVAPASPIIASASECASHTCAPAMQHVTPAWHALPTCACGRACPTLERRSHARNGACRRGSVAGATADICIWDTTTGSCSKLLSYHPVAVQGIAFSPDGACCS